MSKLMLPFKGSLLVLTFVFCCQTFANSNDAEMKVLIEEVSKMYMSSMVYIFKNQTLINQQGGDKEALFGNNFLRNINKVYKTKYGTDFPKEDHLIKKMVVQAMLEVMENNRALLTDPEIGFKGLIPATFAFQLSDKLGEKGLGLKIKFTRTDEEVRNKLNRPDAWEKSVMEKIKKRPQIYYDTNAMLNGKPAYRQFTPLPMKQYCLNCHGRMRDNPLNIGKDRSKWTNIDMTGFEMENWKLGDFGGGVSISIEKSVFR